MVLMFVGGPSLSLASVGASVVPFAMVNLGLMFEIVQGISPVNSLHFAQGCHFDVGIEVDGPPPIILPLKVSSESGVVHMDIQFPVVTCQCCQAVIFPCQPCPIFCELGVIPAQFCNYPGLP